jgi:hypothetical protein
MQTDKTRLLNRENFELMLTSTCIWETWRLLVHEAAERKGTKLGKKISN